MPPEPFPWDRRDFRKHERSVSDPRFAGGYGGGGPPRWRDQHAPPSQPPVYHHHQQQQRRYSDFRSRPLPPGQGKHAGWHMHPNEAGHGFSPHGSRLGDRSIGEENYRPSSSYSDGGRNFRNNRENRGPLNQKYWRANSWESASSSNIPAKSVEANDQKLTENTQAGNTSNNARNSSVGNYSTYPLGSVNKTENPQTNLKDQYSKDVGDVEGLASTEKGGKETHSGSISWKPLKWSRSGSLSSRGSSLGNSSNAKGLGVDSSEIVTVVQQKKVTPVQSPTEDAPSGVKSDTPVPSEETSCRKKPRLGWGEGLAKYEKKKVDGPEDDSVKSSLVVRVNDIEETVQPHPQNDKSPRFAGFVDCTSPATPSSIAFSSSPGMEEKEFLKAVNVDPDSTSFSCSPSITSHAPASCKKGSLCSSDNLDRSSLADVRSFIFDMAQPEVLCSEDVSQVGVKKLSWKSDILKAIERTETEIDSLENELKLLMSEPQSNWSHQDTSGSLRHYDKEVIFSDSTDSSVHLKDAMPGDKNVENATVLDDDKHRVVDENDSANHVILRYAETPSSGEDLISSQTANALVNLEADNYNNSDKYESNEDIIHCKQTEISRCIVLNRTPGMPYDVQKVCDSILYSNRDSATSAFEPLNKILPTKPFDTTVKSSALCLQRSSLVARKNFLARKQLFRFKEKALAIKSKLFRHFLFQGQIVSIRKLQGMSHKKYDLIGPKKYRFNRSQMSSAWNSRFVSMDDVVEVVRGFISNYSFQPSRNVLRMPALMLDKKGMQRKFISDNGLVEDSCAVEKDRSVINSWTSDERKIFIDKLATFGKNFSKIASFLDLKKTADCVEFYYKNHKENRFEKTWKKPHIMKKSKPQYSTYLVTSGKKWNREAAVASLDLLGEASAIVATADAVIDIREKSPSKNFGASNSYKASSTYDSPQLRSTSPDLYGNEREAVAADVLAGICGSLSSEAMSSCITNSINRGDGYRDWRCQRVGFSPKSPFIPEVVQNIDDECSDDSCGELDPVDWSDEEKSIFMQALSTYGKDFVMISECVRTRSKDQCKVFFSKARKCLRLDSFHPELGIVVPGDVNGGGSDIVNVSVLETNLVTHNVGLECKMDEHHVEKLNHKASDLGEEQNLEPDLKQHLDSLDQNEERPVLRDSLMDDYQINETNGCQVDVHRQNGSADSSTAEPILGVEASDCSLNKSIESVNFSFVEVLDSDNGKANQEPEILSSDKNIEQIDINSMDIGGINCAVSAKMESQLTASALTCLPSKIDVSGCQNNSGHEHSAAEKSHRDASRLDDHFASLKSSTLFSVPIRYHKLVDHNPMSSAGVNELDKELSQKILGATECHLNVGGHTRSDLFESAHILKGYPISAPVGEERNRSSSCNTMSAHQNTPCLDGNLHLRDCSFSLQKCNSRHHCEDVSCPSRGETTDQSRPQCSSSSLEKPSTTGDVMLFGKILTSSQQKPNACGERKPDNYNQNYKSNSSSLNRKCGGEQRAILDSAVTKFDSNILGSENIPVANFGFWDENRIQTGSPSIPDSTFLLAKYPSAFANYPAKVEQHAVHSDLKNNNLNGVSVFPSKETCGSTSVNGEVQPFTFDMKNPRDIFISGMQCQNMLNVVTGRGGVVGGQCSGVSDPVAAIKMHYERFGLQAGNIIEEDETWRSKRDLGR